jgi:signal transduction histidine kinase
MNENPGFPEEKYALIVANAPVPLIEIGENGEVLQLNVAGEQLLDPLFAVYQLEPTHLFPLLDRIAPEMTAAIRSFHQPHGRIVYSLVKSFRLPPPASQNERYFQYHINKISPGWTIVHIEDHTERYEEQKLMQQSILEKAVAQARFEMAAELLHDIGNALTGLGSYHNQVCSVMDTDSGRGLRQAAGFLSEQRNNLEPRIGQQQFNALHTLLESTAQLMEENQQIIREVADGQQQIISHVQDILAIHRQYVNGHPSQDRKPVDLAGLLRDSCAMVQVSCQKKSIALHLDTGSAIPEIKGDRVKLMQVMLNLLRNSIDAITERSVDKQINVRLALEADKVMIEIIDTGEGLDPTTVRRLFERGYTTKAFGTGLGLYNCRSIIESHGGTINFSSDGSGKGTKTAIHFTTQNCSL